MNILLDNYLCLKYPKIFRDRNKSAQESCLHWGLCCGDGWFYLINKLCYNIQYHIDNPNWVKNEKTGKYEKPKKPTCPQVIALQIKEKFSGLRVYVEGGDEYTHGLIDMAESLSFDICDECGLMDNTVGRNTKGWLVTRCKKHKQGEGFDFNDNDDLREIWKKIEAEETHNLISKLKEKEEKKKNEIKEKQQEWTFTEGRF